MEKDDKSWPRATWDQLAGKSVDTSLRLLVRDHRQLVSRVLSPERALHDAYVRIDDPVAEVERSPVAVGRLEMTQEPPPKPMIHPPCGDRGIAGVRHRPHGDSYRR